MRQFIAFTKKEFLEQFRTGRLLILLIVFLLFGIMNPAVAKLTPWMITLFSESFSDAGMTVTMDMDITALTSWAQFYKNIPIALIIFLLLSAGTLTSEYQKGTLVNMLTKGMPRFQVLLAKVLTLTVVWSAGYWLCYGITYGYNFYFWDNRIASHLFPAACCVYLAGIWLISLIMLASSILHTNSAVLSAAGGVVAICYLVSFIPAISKYLPVRLLSASALLTGASAMPDYVHAVWTTIVLSVLAIVLAVVCFNKHAV